MCANTLIVHSRNHVSTHPTNSKICCEETGATLAYIRQNNIYFGRWLISGSLFFTTTPSQSKGYSINNYLTTTIHIRGYKDTNSIYLVVHMEELIYRSILLTFLSLILKSRTDIPNVCCCLSSEQCTHSWVVMLHNYSCTLLLKLHCYCKYIQLSTTGSKLQQLTVFYRKCLSINMNTITQGRQNMF